jgi:hypothetical protein
MPHEEGVAHFEIARRLPAGNAARQRHLERACEIFSSAELAYELGQARQALARAHSI